MLELIVRRPNLRLLMSSSQPMEQLKRNGFHEDIAGLRMIQVRVPTLKERKQDLPVLLESLMRQSARSMNIDMP